MSALYWLAVPVVTTLVAMVLVAWFGRSGRRLRGRYDQLEQFHRFRQAMEDDGVEARRSGGRHR